MMNLFISLFLTFILVKYEHLHRKYTSDNLSGPQKIHVENVPRIGGVPIFASLLLSQILSFSNPTSIFLLLLIFCSLPTFLSGLWEDLTKSVSIKVRFLMCLISATMLVQFADVKIENFDLVYLNWLFIIPGFSLLFTIFAVAGLTNAYNIIDGLNGLSSISATSCLTAIYFASIKYSDPLVSDVTLCIILSIIGFLVFNFPKGNIFLGDCGAYFLGFMCGALSILLVMRNPEVSPWYAILISIYPIFETIYSIYRRKIDSNIDVNHPDDLHLHSLLYKNLSSLKFNFKSNYINSFSSLIISIFLISINLIAYNYINSSLILILTMLLFIFVYIITYKFLLHLAIKYQP